MQQHPLVGLGESEGITHLGAGPTLDVSKAHDLLLRSRKGPEGIPHHSNRLVTDDSDLRMVVPSHRELGPMARVPAGGSLESVRVEGGSFVVGVTETRERNRASIAYAAGASDVHENAIDPGLERRPLLEAIDPAQHADPDVLDHLIGGGIGGHVGPSDASQGRVVLFDQLPERRLVSGAQARDKVVVRGGGIHCHDVAIMERSPKARNLVTTPQLMALSIGQSDPGGRMPKVSFDSLAVVLAVGFLVPLLLGFVPSVRVPAVVVEIVAGIVVGPQVLGWAQADEPVQILALVGLAFLLFLAGLEIDTSQLKGQLLRVAGVAFGLSVLLALIVGGALDAFGVVRDPLFAAVVLLATSLGLVIPVLREANVSESRLGQLVIIGSSIGDFAAVILLSLLFSKDSSDTGTRVVLLVGFAVAVAVFGYALSRHSRGMKVGGILLRLQDTTAQIRVRGSMLLLIVLVVVAERFGLETILGAFVAGVLVGFLDRDGDRTHPLFHTKLDALGYGFLIPIFFVASGLRFDLNALLDQPSTLLKVPLFLAALLAVRGVPALAYRSIVGTRGALAAGFLQATSLPFIVAATQIGIIIGALTGATAAAFVAAGLVSALIFPVISLALARGEARTESGRSAGRSADH